MLRRTPSSSSEDEEVLLTERACAPRDMAGRSGALPCRLRETQRATKLSSPPSEAVMVAESDGKYKVAEFLGFERGATGNG